MMSFTSTPTLQAGDENPGGAIRQGEGFGLGEFAFFPVGDVRLESMRSLPLARTMGDAERNVGKSANTEVGGPRSPRRTLGSVNRKGRTVARGFCTGRGACRCLVSHSFRKWDLAK